MSTLDVLIAARAEVEKGWCKKAAVDVHGNVCAVGAIETARGVSKLPRRNTTIIVGNVLDTLECALPQGYRSVPLFNDDPHTTQADVLALFDRAIAAEAVKVTADPAHTYTVA